MTHSDADEDMNPKEPWACFRDLLLFPLDPFYENRDYEETRKDNVKKVTAWNIALKQLMPAYMCTQKQRKRKKRIKIYSLSLSLSLSFSLSLSLSLA